MRDLQRVEAGRLAEILRRTWGSTRMVAHGRLFDVPTLPGLVAESGAEWLGHLSYEIQGDTCELVLIESLRQGVGVGSALIDRLAGIAREHGIGRIRLTTTNDNLAALGFYQRRGFVLVELRRDAVTVARRTLKPEIPLIGMDGIPLRDELELELSVDRS